ncbi:MAG: hypothetical protein PVJ57_03520 [Phycisphaerae bacterium]|jgi:hypothetical protein
MTQSEPGGSVEATLSEPSGRTPRKRRLRFWLVVALLVVGVVCAVQYWRRGRPYVQLPPAFEGDSTALKSTVIVPTLDTPVPEGKSAVWCAAFELAWTRLKEDVVKDAIKVAGAGVVADRLNASTVSADDLTPEAYYATAGVVSEAFIGSVQQELADRFPGETPPEMDHEDVLAALAYLKVSVPFTIPFFDNTAEFVFNDGGGGQTAVTSFGIRPNDEYAYRRLREQVRVLYAKPPDSPSGGLANGRMTHAEFAIDPCRTTEPFQIVLAVVPRGDTLAATLADLESKIENWSPKYNVEFGLRDVLLIPNTVWKITHHFDELEGQSRLLLNPGFDTLWIETAMQTIEFKLDRSGAELDAQVGLKARPIPTDYVFDRPFLIYMKKRGAEHPFFVMWVDNAELLVKS